MCKISRIFWADMNTVFTRMYEAPPLSRTEILRYAGARQGDPLQEALLEECLAALGDRLSFRVCYSEFQVAVSGDVVDLGFAKVTSAALAKCLGGVTRAVVFAATVGPQIDRLITRYSAISPAKALLLDAIGTERVEALCDAFCRELKEEAAARGCFTRPRFSPGYGDLPLAVQKEIFGALDCARKIGVSLSEGLLMTPTKSVTAIVGIGKNI